MKEIIDKVRSRVLDLVSQQPENAINAQDVETNVRNRDGLIRLFCTQFIEDCDSHDVDAISMRILQTLTWRTSYGIATSRDEDFPLEFWTRNHLMYYEDDEYFICVHNLSRHKRISQRWSDLLLKFFMHIMNKYTLEAVNAGKKVIAFANAIAFGLSNLDKQLSDEIVRIMDTHYPCLCDKTGVCGIPWVVVPVANLFIKFSMPRSIKNRFKVYSKETISQLVDPEHLPELFGGKLQLNELLDVSSAKLTRLRQFGEEHGFEEWEIRNIVHYYESE